MENRKETYKEELVVTDIKPLTYASSGVDYGDLDPAKVLGQRLGEQTGKGPNWLGVMQLEGYRGESAPILMIPGGFISHVEEGLGTKVLMADLLYDLTGDASGYACAAQDTVAMIVNDMITLGIPPVSLQMHLAVGSGNWLRDVPRVEALMHGWRDACIQSGAAWTGGETPALKDIVDPGTAVLAGSAAGYLPNPHVPFREEIEAGDKIIGFESSGVHANGISLVRKIASSLPEDRALDIYWKALVPTVNYVKLVNELIRRGIRPSYVIHVTGHGWRKIMRAKPSFTYRITRLQPEHEIFGDIQSLGNVEKEEMWGNYNMGTGFALIVRPQAVGSIYAVAADTGYRALEIGEVEAGPKRVIIEPVDVAFEEKDMSIRQ